MLKFAAELRVDRPVEQVFAWLTNAENQGKFDKSSLKMEALTPGPWRSGTQFRELRDLGGRKTEVLSEVAELDPNRRFVIWRSMDVLGEVRRIVDALMPGFACMMNHCRGFNIQPAAVWQPY